MKVKQPIHADILFINFSVTNYDIKLNSYCIMSLYIFILNVKELFYMVNSTKLSL